MSQPARPELAPALSAAWRHTRASRAEPPRHICALPFAASSAGM